MKEKKKNTLNNFKGNSNDQNNNRSTDQQPQQQNKEENKLINISEIKNINNEDKNQLESEIMSEAAVSFVVGGPEPNEELENEDCFPGDNDYNDGNQLQPPLLPGLVERRKRLR